MTPERDAPPSVLAAVSSRAIGSPCRVRSRSSSPAGPITKRRRLSFLDALLPHTGNSARVGITGVPGVGKSTLIEALGARLIDAGHRVGVLASIRPVVAQEVRSSETRRGWGGSPTIQTPSFVPHLPAGRWWRRATDA